MRSRPWIVVLAAVAIAGCGGEETLSASRADELHAQVAAVRDAAGEGDRAGALRSLDGLEAAVRDLEAGGSLARADADALRRGIGRARRRARAEIAEPTPEPTPRAGRHTSADRHAGAAAGQARQAAEGQGQRQEGEGRLMRPEQGATLAGGRYTFERHLGSGGMASVWLARDETLHREVAIKLMADTLADDERWLARFKREARAAAALSHPHIVKVFDFGIEEHRPYLVMAHVPGGSLRDRQQDGGELPDPERLARELLGALAHVHAAGIVHRDVKPGNILLDEHGSAHLTDFGIARPQDATAMTQTGMVMGTIRYLAPEVAERRPGDRAQRPLLGGLRHPRGRGRRSAGALAGAARRAHGRRPGAPAVIGRRRARARSTTPTGGSTRRTTARTARRSSRRQPPRAGANGRGAAAGRTGEARDARRWTR